MSHKIPWAQPNYWGSERQYVTEALDSTWISGGKFLDRLETDFCRWTSQQYALATSNGTTAIHLAYLAAGLTSGDEVIIPGFCFLAAANVALNMGAIPVFAEVDPETWCVTAESIAQVISAKTKIVVPVHTYGNSCKMDEIRELCIQKKITLIEDAAESLGTLYKGQLTGTFGDIGCFSFQATKTITTGEGGMVVTNQKNFSDTMKLYRSHGMDKTRYWHEVAGMNFRLTNLQAALGCAQFEKLDAIRAAHVRKDQLYRKHLVNNSGITCQLFGPDIDPVVWAIAVKLSAEAYPQGRDEVMKQMAAAGIETRPGFYAASLMKHIYSNEVRPVPICTDLSRQIISLPSSPTLTEDEIGYVCDQLNSFKR